MALAFFTVQRNGALPGGPIAPAKLIWLSLAIFFWFCLPALLLRHPQLSQRWRWLLGIFLANMSLRAVVELYLMYGPQAWQPGYGIAHDLATALALTTALIWIQFTTEFDKRLRTYALIVISMLLADAGFAIYLLSQFENAVEAAIYFVPSVDAHRGILRLTIVLNGAVIVAWFWMYRTYVTAQR